MSGLAKARTWSTNGTANRSANTEGQSNGKGNGNGNGNENAREHRAPRKISRPLPPPPSPPSFSTDTATATSIETHEKTSIDHHGGLLPKDGKVEGATEPVLAAPSFLQPRIAAVLGVSRRWHPVLFSLRLLSIVPAICLGFPLAIRFLLMVHEYATSEATPGPSGRTSAGDGEDRLLLTETLLAVIWVGTILCLVQSARRKWRPGDADLGPVRMFGISLLLLHGLPHVEMVRSCDGAACCTKGKALLIVPPSCLRLINYTPSATAFRLVSVSALNGYLQSWTLHLSGSSQDPFLLLPTWITITSVRTLPLQTPIFLLSLADFAPAKPDPHLGLPHHLPQDQYPQGDLHLHQRFLHGKLL